MCVCGVCACVCVITLVVVHVRHEETVVTEPFWLPEARYVFMMLSVSPNMIDYPPD